jgi:hypothetical protein
MDNSEHYDYYASDKNLRDTLHAEYSASIPKAREDAEERLRQRTGCIAWITYPQWAGPELIGELCYPDGAEILNEKYIIKTNRRPYDGGFLNEVRGNESYKDGKAFNLVMRDANVEFKSFPSYPEWLIERLALMRTGFGNRQPNEGNKKGGTPMLDTLGGDVGDCLVFAIPNTKDEENSSTHGTVAIPDTLTPISAAQFELMISRDSSAYKQAGLDADKKAAQTSPTAQHETSPHVCFHDRGTSRERRAWVDGKIILRDDEDQEMLDSDLCLEVEKQISNGLTQGVTTHPCYPDWMLHV